VHPTSIRVAGDGSNDDPDSASCMLSKVQHLVVPTNASAIAFAYCEVNKD